MAINFSELPQESPNALPEVDLYYATIAEATMKAPNDATKPDYLSLKLQLTDKDGKGCGTMYDILSESDSSVVQYKLGRFVRACGIPLQGVMELKDLAKLVVNKQIVVDVKHDQDKEKKYPPKAAVDIFSREAYYLPCEFEEIYNIIHAITPTVSGTEDFMNPTEETFAVADDSSVTQSPTEY